MALAGPLYKFATQTASVEVVTFYSCLAALAGATVFLALNKKWRIDRKRSFSILLLSFLYTTAMLSFSFVSKNENPAIVSLLSRSNVIFSFLISFLYFKEYFSSKIGIGIVLISSGTLFLLSTKTGISVFIGTVLILYYALAFSVHNGILKTLDEKDCLPVLAVQNLFAVIGIFLFSADKKQFFQISTSSLNFAIAAGFLSSFLGFILYQKGLHLSSFSEVTAVRSLGPVIALAVTYPFFPIEFDQYKIAGSILILAGVFIFNFRRKLTYDKA